MYSPFLVCGTKVCLVQVKGMQGADFEGGGGGEGRVQYLKCFRNQPTFKYYSVHLAVLLKIMISSV